MSHHVLMVNEFFTHGDGSSLYITKVSEALLARGYRVSALYGTQRERTYYHPSIETHFVPNIFGFNYVNTTKGLEQIKGIVQKTDPDGIYVHQVLNPHVVSLLADLRPSIRYEHGFRLSCPTGRRDARRKDTICRYPFSFRCMVRAHTQHCMPRNPVLAIKRIRDVYLNIAAHRKLAKIIVASRYINDLLIMSGLPAELITINPYFVDVPAETAHHAKTGKPCILFVGRMEYEKGPAFLMSALSHLDEPVRAVFVGEGPELENLKTMAGYDRRHEFEFPGWIDNKALEPYYRQADVLVVPSVWPEPFGIIGIEAMSYGVPVVAFDVGGISEWLKDGVTGLLVERKNVPQLAEKINDLLGNTENAVTMGKEGRGLMKKLFTLEVHMENLTAVFERAFR